MERTIYHRLLRVSLLVVALLLVFESGLVFPDSARIASDTRLYLANAIGMSARIEPNELNSLTAELTTQKRALEEREAAIREREIDIGLRSDNGSEIDYSTYLLASILFILLVLILLNYTLDYFRSQSAVQSKITTRKTV